jgi:uncharacterized protein YeaC (DUF1315 family)
MTREELLEESIARMQRILDLGAWPTGVPITSHERTTIEWNLELAREERRKRHARRQAVAR